MLNIFKTRKQSRIPASIRLQAFFFACNRSDMTVPYPPWSALMCLQLSGKVFSNGSGGTVLFFRLLNANILWKRKTFYPVTEPVGSEQDAPVSNMEMLSDVFFKEEARRLKEAFCFERDADDLDYLNHQLQSVKKSVGRSKTAVDTNSTNFVQMYGRLSAASRSACK